MKSIKLLLLSLLLSCSIQMFSQPPPPPPPDPDDTPLGGNAPIFGGELILIGMALAYGGKKFYKQSQKKEQLPS